MNKKNAIYQAIISCVLHAIAQYKMCYIIRYHLVILTNYGFHNSFFICLLFIKSIPVNSVIFICVQFVIF